MREIISLDFHTKFFPRLLWARLRGKKKEEEGVRFNSNMEFILGLFLCLALAGIGVPLAVKQGSMVGWVLSILGTGGVLAIIIFSILAELGTKPSYDNFLIGVFFFFVFLGVSAGMLIGKNDHSLLFGILSSVSGLLLGYIVGIFAGLEFQRLGWFASIVNMLSGFGILLIAVVDLVLLLR